MAAWYDESSAEKLDPAMVESVVELLAGSGRALEVDRSEQGLSGSCPNVDG